MSEDTNRLSVPLAIVIAGALIAGAVYLSNTKTTQQPTGTVTQQKSQEQLQKEAQEKLQNMEEVTQDDHIRGAQDAQITIVEYTDLECPFCQRFHTTMQQVLDEYPNDVRWVVRHAPIERLHSKAPAEANAAECAAEQGKFWEFIDIVFETTPSNNGLDLETLPDLASQAGVENIEQFKSCVTDEKHMEKVNADLADAQNSGMRGTPFSILVAPDGTRKPIHGAVPYESVKATIDSLL